MKGYARKEGSVLALDIISHLIGGTQWGKKGRGGAKGALRNFELYKRDYSL